MPIKEFKRIENYFSGIKKVNADNIDLQFNQVTDYLNGEIYKVLDNLSSGRIPASVSPNDINKFLYNIGDGNISWKSIDGNAFKDKSLSLNKLVRSNSGSIFRINSENKLTSTAPEQENEVMVLSEQNIPKWSMLTGKNIKDRSITGQNILPQTIGVNNLPPELLQPLIKSDSIDGSKFKNQNITSDKLANNTLTIGKMTPDFAKKFIGDVWDNIIPNNYLTGLDFNKMLGNNVFANREEIVRIFKDNGASIYSNAGGQGQGATIGTIFSASKFGSTVDTEDRFAGIHVYGKINALKK